MAIKEKALDRMLESITGRKPEEIPKSPKTTARFEEVPKEIHPLLWRILGWGAAHGFFVNSVYGFISGSVAFVPEEDVEEKHWEWIVALDETKANFLLECAKHLNLPAEKFETVWERETKKGEPVAVPLWMVRIDYWRLLDETGGDAWRDVILLGSARYPLAPIGGAIVANARFEEITIDGRKRKVLTFWATKEEADDFIQIMTFFDLDFKVAESIATLPAHYNDKLNRLKGEDKESVTVFYLRKRSANFIFKRYKGASEEAGKAVELARGVREGEETTEEIEELEGGEEHEEG